MKKQPSEITYKFLRGLLWGAFMPVLTLASVVGQEDRFLALVEGIAKRIATFE